MRRTVRHLALILLPGAALLGGCAGMDLTPVASFGASNVLSPSGYSETQVSDTQFQVTATGTEATPKTRIEKIARARAAQIGVEKKLKYYKVSSVQYGAACTKGQEIYKGGSTAAESRQKVVLDVVYAKEPADASFVSSEETFTALNAELTTEVVSPEEKAAATAESRANCGQSI